MKKYIIDTNTLISYVTDRNPEQQKKIAPLFQAVADNKACIICHQNVLIEFIYVMDKIYRLSKNEISKIINEFIEMRGIEIIHEIDFNTVLSYWPDQIPDLGDAVIASLGKIKRVPIVTFDRKFSVKLKILGFNLWV
jgi:predicted nucleic-acid-binding protein